MSTRRRVRAAVALAIALGLFGIVDVEEALASGGCDALNQPTADGLYFKGRILVSELFAGDVISIRAAPPLEDPGGTGLVPFGFYLGIGQVFDPVPIVPIVKLGETLVYTVPQDLGTVTVVWATTPVPPNMTEIGATWTVSCTNAPKSSPTLTTSASPATLLGGPVYDTATLTGGTKPTGTITFRLYGPNNVNCTEPAAFTTSVPIDGNGNYQSPGLTPTAVGTYRWTAEYAGDARNNGATSPCNAANESVEVTPFVPPAATSTVTGNAHAMTVTNGQSVLIQNAQVAGPITVQAGGALTLVNAKVSNGIVATNPAFVSICGSQITAPPDNPSQGVVISGAVVPLRIGDPAAGCAGNRVGGGVSVSTNTGGATLGANIVSGGVTVDGNTGGQVVIKGNNMSATMACAGNAPAPVNGGQVNTAAAKSGQCAGL